MLGLGRGMPCSLPRGASPGGHKGALNTWEQAMHEPPQVLCFSHCLPYPWVFSHPGYPLGRPEDAIPAL